METVRSPSVSVSVAQIWNLCFYGHDMCQK